MSTAEKTIALLVYLSEKDVAALSREKRQRLADECRRVAELAETTVGHIPSSGVLADLREGYRSP